MDNYYSKYLKYKKKYLELKKKYVFNEEGRMVEETTREPISQNKINTGSNVNTVSFDQMVSFGQSGKKMLLNMSGNLDGKAIIRNCSSNMQLCNQINWEQLLVERKINFNSSIPIPIPKMCDLMTDNKQKKACAKFYHYTKGGTIVTWGRYWGSYGGRTYINNPPEDSGYVDIASGFYHSVALKNDGTIVTFGVNNKGQLVGLPRENNFVKIACGDEFSVALDKDGRIFEWGNLNDYKYKKNIPESQQSTGPPEEGGYIDIVCGYAHRVALRNDGTIVTWGNNIFDQRNNSPEDSGYKAIACGGLHSVALREDGTIVTWGNNGSNQLFGSPRGNNFDKIACGRYHSVALTKDGRIVTWGTFPALNNSPSDDGFKQIACGTNFSVAITKNDNIVIWGDPYYLDKMTFPPVDNNINIVEIACGEYHGVALREDGKVIAWGDHDYFGDILDHTNNTPEGYGYFKISSGMHHIVALKYT